MISTTDFKKWFFLLLAETFGVADTPHGVMLDTGRSGLIGTINTISAEIASAAPTPDHATIAAHCGHILFLLNHFAAYERGETPTMDWPSSWKTRVVDDAAWQALRNDVQTAYDSVVARLQAREEWPEAAVAASMVLLAHCAYHVGEIRQRLLWVAA
jgi:hypothetical protein